METLRPLLWTFMRALCATLSFTSQIIKDDKKLEDNSLKFAAQTFLDPEYGKIDMTPAEIFKAWREQDPERMAAMLDYCARDADIPAQLMQRLSYVPIWVEMSRVTFTPLSLVLNGGQQRKVYNLIARFVHGTHALNKADSGWPVSAIEDDDGLDDDGPLDAMEDALKKRRPDYQGATVIEPCVGFYQDSVSTLDFESLYPSIIIHFNLCPSVYVGPSDGGAGPESSSTDALTDAGFIVESHRINHAILEDAETDKYAEFTRDYRFVKNVSGVLPRLLQHLLRARKVAKKAMAAASDEFERSVQNGRQLALKVSCNSVYGFTGTNPKRGLLSCKPVAAVTTLRGRAFIEAAKNYVEKTYACSKVLYGDTGKLAPPEGLLRVFMGPFLARLKVAYVVFMDSHAFSGPTADSIMINWGPTVSIPDAYRLAEQASAAITELLRAGAVEGASKPVLASAASAVTLANEKVYRPYLLIQKKTYAAMKYTIKGGRNTATATLEDFDCEMDMKGVDAVRRDRSKLVKEVSGNILEALLIKGSLEEALNGLKATAMLVATQKAPLEWFVLSKSLKATYASENQPQLQAWKRMQARGDPDVPEIGTRMPFVVTQGPPGKAALKIYEKAEHPDHVRRAKLPYDARYYLENAQDVIERLLAPTGMQARVKQVFEDALAAAEHKASGNRSLLDMFGPGPKKSRMAI